MRLPFRFTIDAYLLRHRPEEYKLAEAYYTYKGEALDRQLNKIKNQDEVEYKKNELMLDLKYKKIDEYEYDIKFNELVNVNETDRLIGKLDVDMKHKKIDEYEYELGVANIKKEPYMRIIDSNIDYTTMEFSYKPIWNNYFIEWLIEIGYTTVDKTEQEMVDTYIKDVFCSQVLNDISDDVDDDEIEENLMTSQTMRETLIRRELDSENNKVIYS